MTKQVESLFSKYEFTEQEEPIAQVFTDLQRKHIQNELAHISEAKARLAVDIDSPNATAKFLQEHEYYRGQIEILLSLLAISDNKQQELIQQLREATEAQQGE